MSESRDERISRLLDEIIHPPKDPEATPDELARSILESSGSVQRPTVTPAEVERICKMNVDDMDPFQLAIFLGSKS